MLCLDTYINELNKIGFDAETRLNAGSAENAAKLREAIGRDIPDEPAYLCERFDGENGQAGFIAGFELLSVDDILLEYEFFKQDDTEYEPFGTDAIMEKPMSECLRVPFAFDGSDCFIAIDLTPSKSGTVGQIIGIDTEENLSCLFASGLDEFFGKMAEWLRRGDLVIDAENDFSISERSGHLFNDLQKYATVAESGSKDLVPLDGEFWTEYYSKDIVKSGNGFAVPSSVLAREKSSFRIMNDPVSISCRPFEYMENVRSLVIHDSELRDFECIARMPSLKELYLIRCTIVGTDVTALASSATLKRLSIGAVGDPAALAGLAEMRSLKELTVSGYEGFDTSVLSDFSRLESLCIQTGSVTDTSFLNGLRKLKKLDLDRSVPNNLDFLPSLSKLTEFRLLKAAKDENGLSALRSLKKLTSFVYPVNRLEIYAGCSKLTEVGLSVDNDERYEVFKGSSVSSFMLLGTNATNDDVIERVANKMEKYVSLSSYGATE